MKLLMSKKLTSIVAASVLLGFVGCTNEPGKQTSVSQTTKKITHSAIQDKVVSVPVDQSIRDIVVNSPVWESAKLSQVTLYPQTTIKVNDRKANKINSERYAKRVGLQSVTDGKYIAMKITWADESKSVQTGTKTDEYADGFAIQIPTEFSNLNQLPYIGMGNPDRSVVVYLRKAYEPFYEPDNHGDVATQRDESNVDVWDSELGNGLEKFRIDQASTAYEEYERVFIAEGFRSTTQIRDGLPRYNTQMQYNENTQMWEALFVRPLNDPYTKLYTDTFPVAFAVWDGEKLNRDGLKKISSWTSVKIEGSKGSDEISELIGTLNKELPEADIKNGEKLAKTNCASCHWFAEVKDAPQFTAPNLQNIGGYSTTEYLRESITKPNEVVVSGYNRNAHPNYKWYYEDGQGGRLSAMPAYDYLKETEVNDIVAYLKTLKAEVK